MQKRKLGRSGLEIAQLMFGGNVFGWTADEQTSFTLLDSFIGAGFNAIDTADVYSTWVPGHVGGESETIIGKWLKRRGKRDDVIIATKVGSPMAPDKKGLARKYILQAVEDSLKRLQTDYIDLYQTHRDDMQAPIEETMEAYAQLLKQGKVRAIGASNLDAKRLQETLSVSAEKKLPRYESLQPLYNLYDRSELEGPLQDLCVKEKIGVIPYYSLAAGFLTGKYRTEKDLSKSPRGAARVRGYLYLNERGLRVLSGLDQVSDRLGATPAQISLAWLMTRPAIAAPIVSATSLPQLSEIIQSVALKLDDEALKTLNAASAP